MGSILEKHASVGILRDEFHLSRDLSPGKCFVQLWYRFLWSTTHTLEDEVFAQMLYVTPWNLHPQEKHFSIIHCCIAGDPTGLVWGAGFSLTLCLVSNKSFQSGMESLPLRQMKNDDLLLNKFSADVDEVTSTVTQMTAEWRLLFLILSAMLQINSRPTSSWSGENVIDRLFFCFPGRDAIWELHFHLQTRESNHSPGWGWVLQASLSLRSFGCRKQWELGGVIKNLPCQ